MADFPRSLIEFQQRFGDEAACAEYLVAARWPDGFVCPGCGGGKAWRLETKAWTYECASCGRQSSVTAGTIMHHSKLPLTVGSACRNGEGGATRPDITTTAGSSAGPMIRIRLPPAGSHQRTRSSPSDRGTTRSASSRRGLSTR